MHHDKADIKQAPNKITQFIRKVKNTSTGAPGAIGFAKTIGTVAGILAPVPSIGKIKGVQKIAKAFSNTPSGNLISATKQLGTVIKHNAKIGTFGQAVRTASIFGIDGFRALPKLKPLSKQQLKKMSDNMPKSTSQNLQEAFSYPREAIGAFPKSKPVNFKGPNPASKIGAGGNSYPK